MANIQRRRMRLGELLVAAGVLDESRLDAALAEQRKTGGKLGNILVEMGFLNETLMVKALSRQLGLPLVNLDRQDISSSALAVLDAELCERYGVVPIDRNEEQRLVRVATSDPTNYQALDALAFKTNLKVEPVIATASSIRGSIRRHYYGETSPVPSPPSAPPPRGPEPEKSYTLETRDRSDKTRANGRSSPTRDRSLEAASMEIDRLHKKVEEQSETLRELLKILLEKGIIDSQAYSAKLLKGKPTR